MKATLLLKKDHQNVRDLFQLFEQTEDTDECWEIFSRIRDEITVHATIEEEIFYPALERVTDLRELVSEARRDHADVRRQLQEVAGVGRNAEDFVERVEMLRDDLDRHIETEEGEMFRLAREHCSDKEIDDLGDRLQARKDELVREKHLEPA